MYVQVQPIWPGAQTALPYEQGTPLQQFALEVHDWP
jgi:hypothetical protein